METRSILIIDDDTNLRRTLSDILRAKGYVPRDTGTGQGALDKVEEEKPAVALIDLNLEDMSGLEVMREIRERSSGTECIVLTGHATQASAIEAVNLGAYSYVQKPYDVDQLLVTIRRAIEKREAEERILGQERLAAVGQLAAGIAHDFNNLLTGVIGYAELLGMRADIPETAKTDLKRIVRQGQRAAHLIRQILDFSRQSMIQRRSLNLVSFLKESIKFLERTIPESVNIALEMGSDEYSVHADPAQMQQVLTNQAVNARDAMPEGGELRFRLSRRTLTPDERPPLPEMSSGEWIELSVSDTGTGIPPDVRPHVFEPFITTKDVGKGTGLGLSQVYGIVTQHEGFIDVKSEVAEGTTFTLYLPALSLQEDVLEERAPGEVPLGQGETILVVEDEPGVLEMIGMMLERLGYHVLTAGSGVEALDVYDRHRDEIVLVLTDMVMPEMGGVELLYLLKERNPDTKTVVMTGYPLEDEDRKLLSPGISGWLEKPVDLGRLMQVVSEALASSST